MAGNILFITGTDTGIGKSTIASLLVTALCRRHVFPKVMKPIETGCSRLPDGSLQASDAELLWSMSGKIQNFSEVIYRKYQAPAAPIIAAELEGEEICRKEFVTWVQERAKNTSLLVVEGAGGLLVPIAKEFSFADLAQELQMVTLTVVGSRLGAINHSSLTFEVLEKRKIPVIGYVLNEILPVLADSEQEVARKTNQRLLREVAARYGQQEICHFEFQNNGLGASELSQVADSPEIQRLTQAIVEYFGLNR